MTRPRIWIDCDPGHDDVVAILLAAHFGELVGISTVAGNSRLTHTTANALITAQLFDLEIPVHPGCDRPLVQAPVYAPDIHGESGLAGPVLPAITRSAEDLHGVLAIVEATRNNPGLWLVPTGPLTNVAMALRLEPSLVERIAGISLMGGGPTFGNKTPWAEFNIWADPEAAAIVFASGAPVINMCGLNVTHEVLVSLEHAEEMRATAPGERGAFLADVLTHFATAYRTMFFEEALGPLHDPCAVLALTHPELLMLEPRHVEIELTGSHTRGMTVADQRGVKVGAPANAMVATAIDGPGTVRLILDTLADLARA